MMTEQAHTSIASPARTRRTGLCAALSALLAPLVLSLWLPVQAGSEAIQDHTALREAAGQYLLSRLDDHAAADVDVSIGDLDPRLRLARCDEALDVFLPAGARPQGKLSVGVRCAAPRPWTVYLNAQIQLYKDVVAAAQPLRRGSTVSRADLMLIRQEVSAQHGGYFINPDEVVGKMLTRAINRGQLFTPNRLKAPLLIRRGEEVTILAASGNLQVRSRGKALEDAAQGEVLTVRNSRSNRVIQVIAVEPGTVKVNL